MMDGKQFLAKRRGKPFGFRRNSICPKPVMRLQFDRNGWRHVCRQLAYGISAK